MQNNTWPNYSSKEISKVVDIIKSGKVNYVSGLIGKKFEYLFSKWVNQKYSVALSNGTVALELAIKSLKLPDKSEIMVTARSFFSSASTIVRTGNVPKFIDVDLYSQNILIEDIIKKITPKTRAIICVHLGGNPCEMKKIIRIAKKYKLKIIEDCAQAHGAEIDKKKVGSFGDVATWSFCNDKIISTLGEGGMISTNKKRIYNFINSYKDHGLSFNKNKNKNEKFVYNKDYFGSNYRLTEVQSSVGIIQLEKIKDTLKKRAYIATQYQKKLKEFNNFLYFYDPPINIKPAWYRFYIFVRKDLKGYKNLRNQVIQEFRKKKIICNYGSCPEIYLEKAFRNSRFKLGKRLHNCKILGQTSIALDVNHTLAKKDIHLNSKKIYQIVKKLTKSYIKKT
jgi:dTDP-4-amino-4,6-dideoxygalactose transaminase